MVCTWAQVTGQYMVANGLSTYAVSESQKIGHVTFFWNGNRAAPFDSRLETFHEVGRPPPPAPLPQNVQGCKTLNGVERRT